MGVSSTTVWCRTPSARFRRPPGRAGHGLDIRRGRRRARRRGRGRATLRRGAVPWRLGLPGRPRAARRPAVPMRRCRGIVSIMTGNAYATAVQPALERRWADALASFRRADRGRRARGAGADTVEEVSELLERYGVAPGCPGTGSGCSWTGSSSPEPSSTRAAPSRWQQPQRSSSKPADEIPAASSAAPFTSSGRGARSGPNACSAMGSLSHLDARRGEVATCS